MEGMANLLQPAAKAVQADNAIAITGGLALPLVGKTFQKLATMTNPSLALRSSNFAAAREVADMFVPTTAVLQGDAKGVARKLSIGEIISHYELQHLPNLKGIDEARTLFNKASPKPLGQSDWDAAVRFAYETGQKSGDANIEKAVNHLKSIHKQHLEFLNKNGIVGATELPTNFRRDLRDNVELANMLEGEHNRVLNLLNDQVSVNKNAIDYINTNGLFNYLKSDEYINVGHSLNVSGNGSSLASKIATRMKKEGASSEELAKLEEAFKRRSVEMDKYVAKNLDLVEAQLRATIAKRATELKKISEEAATQNIPVGQELRRKLLDNEERKASAIFQQEHSNKADFLRRMYPAIKYEQKSKFLVNDIKETVGHMNRVSSNAVALKRVAGDVSYEKLRTIKLEELAKQREQLKLDIAARKDLTEDQKLSAFATADSEFSAMKSRINDIIDTYSGKNAPNHFFGNTVTQHAVENFNSATSIAALSLSPFTAAVDYAGLATFKMFHSRLPIYKEAGQAISSWDKATLEKFAIGLESDASRYNMKHGLSATDSMHKKSIVTEILSRGGAIAQYGGQAIGESISRQAFMMAFDNAIAVAQKMTKGIKLTDIELRDAAQAGLTDDIAKKITVNYAKHAEQLKNTQHTIVNPHLENWDTELLDTFVIKLKTQIEQVVTHPVKGETMLFLESKYAKPLFRFWKIATASFNKQILPLLQKGDAETLYTLNGRMALGALIMQSRMVLNGKEDFISEKPDQFLYLTIAQSGVLGQMLTLTDSINALDSRQPLLDLAKTIMPGISQLDRYAKTAKVLTGQADSARDITQGPLSVIPVPFMDQLLKLGRYNGLDLSQKLWQDYPGIRNNNGDQ